VHLASAEVMARVLVVGSKAIEPGGSGWAQLRLERPAVTGRGDRLILRSYSPVTTIGGAQVVDPLPPKRRRRDATAFVEVAQEPPAQAALRMIEAAGVAGVSASTLAARLTLPARELAALLSGQARVVVLGREGTAFLSRRAEESLAEGLLQLLEGFHAENPLRTAMPKEELRRRVFGRSPEGAFEHTLGRLEAAGRVRLQGEGVSVEGHTVRLTREEEQARKALVDAAQAAGLSGLEAPRLSSVVGGNAGLAERVARVLVAEGLLCRVGDALIHRESLEALKEDVRRRWPPGSQLDVGGVKELTGLSRKFVIPLLEYLDRERVTRRAGNERVVLASRGGLP
jgi:selenocysteine-specific elongation factor